MLDALYSCLIIEADQGTPPMWDLFSYGQAQPICGSRQPATAAHTNIPRSGYSGLPMGWEARITRWRATTNLRIDEPILDWAAETTAELHCNNSLIARTPLIELLMAPQPLGGYQPYRYRDVGDVTVNVAAGNYLWMRENLQYEVRVTPMKAKLTEDLQRYLIEHTMHHKMTLWVRLEGEIDKAPL